MKLATYSQFLTDGNAQLTGRYRAVGIHPSSEVDLVDVDQYRLGVGAIVPMSNAGAQLRAVRHAPIQLGAVGSEKDVGQKLVLQLYEECDQLIPPGPRLAVSRSAVILAADLGAVAAGANLAFRLPFQGRKKAAISFKRIASTADLSLVIIGVRYTEDRNATNAGIHYVEKATETWWNGGGAAPAIATGSLAATLEAAQVYVGSLDDDRFDELLVYVFGAADAGNNAQVSGAAYGEADR